MTDDLARRLHDACRLTGRFLLRGGGTSSEYFDKYLFESRPALLRDIIGGLTPLLPPGTDVLAGLELGGIPLATGLSLATNLPLVFVRKRAKEYGTRKIAEGTDVRGKTVVVIEDVITTGGAVVEAVRALRDQGARVETVLCVIDRESGGLENLKAAGLDLKPLFKTSALRQAAGVSAGGS